MTERKEQENKTESQKWAAERLLMFIKVCPQIVRTGTGAEQFVEELNDAAKQLKEDLEKTADSLLELLPIIAACPNIFNPGIGLEAFGEDLYKAASKFNSYFLEKTTE